MSCKASQENQKVSGLELVFTSLFNAQMIFLRGISPRSGDRDGRFGDFRGEEGKEIHPGPLAFTATGEKT